MQIPSRRFGRSTGNASVRPSVLTRPPASDETMMSAFVMVDVRPHRYTEDEVKRVQRREPAQAYRHLYTIHPISRAFILAASHARARKSLELIWASGSA